MEKENLENLAVGGKGIFPNSEFPISEAWTQESEKEREINDKTLEQVIKEVALQEGISEDEVRRHLKLFQDSMNAPKSKTKKQKDKAKSKRKMAKKSKKKNR